MRVTKRKSSDQLSMSNILFIYYIINSDFTFPLDVINEEFNDLIANLLNKSEEKRLKTFEKIKDHPFFLKVNSKKIEKLEMKVPIQEILKPSINAFSNVKYFTYNEIQEKMAFTIKMKNGYITKRKRKLSNNNDVFDSNNRRLNKNK